MGMHELVSIAKTMNLDPEWYLREYFQKTVLYALSALNLSEYYIFQGGTALRIIYSSPRLSLDMDFTIIDRPIDDLKDDSIKIINFLDRFFSAFNLGVAKSREKMIREEGFYRFFIAFNTLNLLRKKIKVKLELVVREYHNIEFRREIILVDFPTRIAFGVRVKTPNQILVDKICSLAGGMHREYVRWRDIFDIYWLTTRQNARIDKKYFEQEFGSWIERMEDLEKLRRELVLMLKHKSYREIIEDLSKVLGKDLITDDLIETYIRTTINYIEQVLK